MCEPVTIFGRFLLRHLNLFNEHDAMTNAFGMCGVVNSSNGWFENPIEFEFKFFDSTDCRCWMLDITSLNASLDHVEFPRSPLLAYIFVMAEDEHEDVSFEMHFRQLESAYSLPPPLSLPFSLIVLCGCGSYYLFHCCSLRCIRKGFYRCIQLWYVFFSVFLFS